MTSPASAKSSMVNEMSGTAECTSRMAALACSIASAPVPARPNWWSIRPGAHSSSTTLASPVAKPSSNMRRSTVKASDSPWPGRRARDAAGGADVAGGVDGLMADMTASLVAGSGTV
jgi:hypothetical protein